MQREVYDEFVERYAAQAQRVVVGPPHEPSTEVGALVHPEHYAKVMGYIEIGRTEGRLVAGGGRPEGFPTGNYVAPTVFADVPPQAGSSRRRSSARSSRSPPSTPTRTPSRSRTA